MLKVHTALGVPKAVPPVTSRSKEQPYSSATITASACWVRRRRPSTTRRNHRAGGGRLRTVTLGGERTIARTAPGLNGRGLNGWGSMGCFSNGLRQVRRDDGDGDGGNVGRQAVAVLDGVGEGVGGGGGA